MNFLDIVANHAKDTLTITDESLKIVNAFRMCKRIKAHEIKGKFRLAPIDKMPGLNIHKARLDDADEMYKVFKSFTHDQRFSLTLPLFDKNRGAVVSTDGRGMLFCDIPEGFTLEKADGGHFYTDANDYPNWTNVLCGCIRENTPYALAGFEELGEVVKGDASHNILAISSACSRAYRHNDGKRLWHTLYLWIGDNQYDPVLVLNLVNALFRLGCNKVGFYYPESGYSYKPLHIVGFGNGLNARGLLMPIQFASTKQGAIELPLKKRAANAA